MRSSRSPSPASRCLAPLARREFRLTMLIDHTAMPMTEMFLRQIKEFLWFNRARSHQHHFARAIMAFKIMAQSIRGDGTHAIRRAQNGPPQNLARIGCLL